MSVIAINELSRLENIVFNVIRMEFDFKRMNYGSQLNSFMFSQVVNDYQYVCNSSVNLNLVTKKYSRTHYILKDLLFNFVSFADHLRVQCIYL